MCWLVIVSRCWARTNCQNYINKTDIVINAVFCKQKQTLQACVALIHFFAGMCIPQYEYLRRLAHIVVITPLCRNVWRWKSKYYYWFNSHDSSSLSLLHCLFADLSTVNSLSQLIITSTTQFSRWWSRCSGAITNQNMVIKLMSQHSSSH